MKIGFSATIEKLRGLYMMSPGNSPLEKVQNGLLWSFSSVIWPISNKYRKYHNMVGYDCPTDPHQILYVDPTSVNYYVRGISKEKGVGRVEDGDWDLNKEPLENHHTYEGLYERFVLGREWKNTNYIQFIHEEKFDKGIHFYGYENIDQYIQQRCSYVDNLYESIKRNGYSLDYQSNDFPDSDLRNSGHTHSLPTLVCIDRHGELLVHDGLHRLVMSQLLNLDKIPVMVLIRHKKWQELREDSFHADFERELPELIKSNMSHPDIILEGVE